MSRSQDAREGWRRKRNRGRAKREKKMNSAALPPAIQASTSRWRPICSSKVMVKAGSSKRRRIFMEILQAALPSVGGLLQGGDGLPPSFMTMTRYKRTWI